MDNVKDSDALLLFQSKDVLQSPWRLIELDAAITHGVPIVAVSCVGKKYDFVAAEDYLLHLETCLETLNADALGVLRTNNVDPLRLAHKLSGVVPNIVSIPLSASGSESAVKASMAGLVRALLGAEPAPVVEGFEEWLARRKTTERVVLEQAMDSGTIRGTQRGRMVLKIERADKIAEELRKEREVSSEQAAKIKRLEAKNETLEGKIELLGR